MIKVYLKKFYHTKAGQQIWRLVRKVANQRYAKTILCKALDINQQPCRNILKQLYSLPEKTDRKYLLLVIPFWGHDATTLNIISMCMSFKKLGYTIHAVMYNNTDYVPSNSLWDFIFPLKTENVNYGNTFIMGDEANLNGNKIDDWAEEDLVELVRILDSKYNYSICLLNYIFMSRAFFGLSDSTLKLLYTHDSFSDRNLRMKNLGINKFYFSTDKEEEKIALDRADIVLAIQEDEKKFFQKLTDKQVYTLPYIPEQHFLNKSRKIENKTLRIGYIASSHAPNIKALENIMKLIGNDHRFEIYVAGSICPELASCSYRNMKILGVVNSVEAFYDTYDVYINPDMLKSGMKIKTIEAFAYGRPLICTKAASAGIDVSKKWHMAADVEECVELVKQCDDNLLAEMSDESKKIFIKFNKKYSMDKLFAKFDKMVNDR